MENEKRLVEIKADLLIKFDEFIDEQKESNRRLGRVESEIVKLNLVSSENTRAIIRLADEVEKISHLHDRVTKLESVVYK